MFTKQSLPDTVDLKMELSQGNAMAREIYRKQTVFVEHFRGLFNKPGLNAQNVGKRLGDMCATWIRSVEAACDFIEAANKIENNGRGRPTWLPNGVSYKLNAAGTVEFADTRIANGAAQAVKAKLSAVDVAA